MQSFTVNDKYSIVCEAQNTRSGFRHLATLLVNGQDTGETVKCTYLNRTWEAYTYQSVLYKLVEKSKWLDKEEKELLNEKIRKGFNRG